MKSFEELLGENNPLLKQVRERRYGSPTEIQEKTIPKILEGRDVIAGAATGSGKTLAFAAGLIARIKKGKGVQGLILTPTRELAEQVAKEIIYFSKSEQLRIAPIYGGVSISPQIRAIETADIIVGTPGRVLDHLNKRSLKLEHINTLVLDEADRMLDMGFREDVEEIISYCNKNRQTLLFSATISQDVVRLSKRHMHEPVEISAEKFVDPKKLAQVYYDVESHLKFSLLMYLLKNETSGLVIVFCNTRRNVDFVEKNLKFSGMHALALHGGHSQEKRNKVMSHFHDKVVHVLIATDVAARGLDIKGISHIYNYDIPKTNEEYIHRIGRTARAGKEGIVINLVSNRDYESFQDIMSGDFNIAKEETPFLKHTRIRWMPERKHERMQRRRDMGRERSGRSGGRERSSGGYGGGHRGGHGGSRGVRSSGRWESRTGSGRDSGRRAPVRSRSSGGFSHTRRF